MLLLHSIRTADGACVNQASESSSEEKGQEGQSSKFSYLKKNDTIRLALKRAVFDRVKIVFFTLPMIHFNQTMLQTFP